MERDEFKGAKVSTITPGVFFHLVTLIIILKAKRVLVESRVIALARLDDTINGVRQEES